ncbi:RNA-directed DNA polymerase, eukaryota, reverse transcriptase zinc-binding domain protein [Tanacetum coccineum]
MNAFYVRDASGYPVDPKIIDSIRKEIGQTILKVKGHPRDFNQSPQESSNRFLFRGLFKTKSFCKFGCIEIELAKLSSNVLNNAIEDKDSLTITCDSYVMCFSKGVEKGWERGQKSEKTVLNNEEKQDLLKVMPFKVEKLRLRVPLTSKMIRIKECKSLIDKVENRVFNWKNKSLAYAGRLMLVASVLKSIHVYWASAILLPPDGVIMDINRILKDFLWNQNDETKGKPKVA